MFKTVKDETSFEVALLSFKITPNIFYNKNSLQGIGKRKTLYF